ncbi:MAG: ABC transporter permease [Clostridiales bacterium]|nr:ABC transporter permease [Clostridiales bacterium]
MKKYMFKRILFSIFSLVVVIACVMLLVYTATERSVIFQMDDVWNKKSNNERTIYEYVQYQKYGYLEYVDYTSFLKTKYQAALGDAYDKDEQFKADKKAIQNAKTWMDNASVQEFKATYEAKGYQMRYLEPIKYSSGKVKPGGTGYYVAVLEKSVFTRLGDYFSHLITFETTNDVKDEKLTDRYVRVEKDPYSGFYAVVGSGTTHKYLLFVDDHFPFIHQNWMHLNLGVSFTKYRGSEISVVICQPQGDLDVRRTQYPAQVGTDQYVDTAIDFHSVTYNYNELTNAEKQQFNDQYTTYAYRNKGLTMLENSFVIGLIATFIAYMLGLPMGVLMSRKKDKLVDKIGNGYIIFIMAVPSLAYIFLFATIGTTLFNLPYKFANAQVKVLGYILPTISLALPSIGSLMKWMRRYMIDQMNSDYVKFARAEGMSESEIFRQHISPNAMIYLVHGIPASILGCLTGAFITERVYAVPGVGNLLVAALNGHDNGVIVGVTAFYTTLSIISIILGDLLLAKYDPRISLSNDKGGGR